MLGIGFATLTAATSRVCAPPTRAWPSRRVRAGPDLIDLHSIALWPLLGRFVTEGQSGSLQNAGPRERCLTRLR